jgi:hypothetical protein
VLRCANEFTAVTPTGWRDCVIPERIDPAAVSVRDNGRRTLADKRIGKQEPECELTAVSLSQCKIQ